ncbi:MAG TPA: DUF349 domain-containing protein [Microbacteriaceae bacterium]|nr:DUF349 domain-containing protein [Microbacteriaceae bacterium]
MTEQAWGRVDETNTVFVREGDTWREVGQYGDVTPEEALAYFVRKFDDFAAQVSLLEARAKRGAPAADIASAAAHLAENIRGAKAVGNLEALLGRIDALGASLSELTEAQKAEAEAARAEAVTQRTAIVEAIERLASSNLGNAQWKNVTAQVDALFTDWQQHQKSAPQLPKSVANELWKRFRTARTTIDTQRRAYFGDLEQNRKEAKSAKSSLIAKAEALAARGADGIPAYRALLDEWKRAPRAGKKIDDALWAQFKAAGDALYSAKAEVDAEERVEFSANLEAKRALLAEGKNILDLTDIAGARTALRSLQEKWDAIGKVPRENIREIEDGLRAIESHVKSLADAAWSKSDPEKVARAEGLAGQLQASIEELAAEIAAAEHAGNAKKVAELTEALNAREAWLAAVTGA